MHALHATIRPTFLLAFKTTYCATVDTTDNATIIAAYITSINAANFSAFDETILPTFI